MQMSCLSSSFYSLILAPIGGSFLQLLLLWCLPDVHFLFPSFPLHWLIGILLERAGPSLSFLPSFIYLLTY